mmetsp:Transcript_8340/g.31406  ORF Transcript_8340/g.31406 Transcript_8340/m.31406 type:complete len:231 (+) Transcript_8340:425-1117(+)
MSVCRGAAPPKPPKVEMLLRLLSRLLRRLLAAELRFLGERELGGTMKCGSRRMMDGSRTFLLRLPDPTLPSMLSSSSSSRFLYKKKAKRMQQSNKAPIAMPMMAGVPTAAVLEPPDTGLVSKEVKVGAAEGGPDTGAATGESVALSVLEAQVSNLGSVGARPVPLQKAKEISFGSDSHRRSLLKASTNGRHPGAAGTHSLRGPSECSAPSQLKSTVDIQTSPPAALHADS